MSVQSVSGATIPATGQQQQAPSQELGESEFLNLLMVQMSNQDPLSPMESADFAAQIASMNTVQQLREANGRLEALLMGMTSLNNQSAVQMVGQNVVARGNQFEHGSEAMHELKFDLGAQAESVTVRVLNADGEEVAVLDADDLAAGENSISWTGLRREGEEIPPGLYTFEVTALDADENEVEAQEYIEGVVTELRFDDGFPVLMVGGAEVTLDGILRVLGTGAMETGDRAEAADSRGPTEADERQPPPLPPFAAARSTYEAIAASVNLRS